MMKKKQEIKHEEFSAYLRGELNAELQESIEKIHNENPVYHLLFELIEKVKSSTGPEPPEEPTISFSRIEQLLERLFSGEFDETDAQQFYFGVLQSPLFYKRILDQLQFAIPELSQEPDPDLANVEMKSDEAILAEVFNSQQTEEDEIQKQTVQPKFKPGRLFDSIKNFVRIPRFSPRFAFAATGFVAIIILFVFGYNSIFKSNNYYPYLSENRVPYEYDSSTFRGAEQDMNATDDALLFSFIRDFKNGVGYYMVREYESAIYIFENLESSLPILEAKDSEGKYTTYFRDLHFYNGLSHLAVASKKETGKTEKSKQLEAAIISLERATSTLAKYKLNNADREAYYLGLAYGLNGQRHLATDQLASINQESQFYDESRTLLKKWGK